MMSVSLAEMQEGRRCVAFDIAYDKTWMNMLSDEGYVHALYQVMNLAPGTFLTLAPVCSSWVFMSRGTTKRTKGRPLGDQEAPSVDAGNRMASRVAILLFIACAKRVHIVMEQPRGSLLQEHPGMQALFSRTTWYKHHILMRNFGGPTDKGTWLYSSHKLIQDLYRFRPLLKKEHIEPPQLVERYVDPSGRTCTKGGPDLKASQAYPLECLSCSAPPQAHPSPPPPIFLYIRNSGSGLLLRYYGQRSERQCDARP
ncbi:unnamed protein product [Symbiodinium natans]|uniref:Uncharacterized protein n=1 Tax=Symbiodinium natans TaxID=878477 RepID=A0A812QHH7_9DINO|nr:unnamed protein product [Symbiodinium natans]